MIATSQEGFLHRASATVQPQRASAPLSMGADCGRIVELGWDQRGIYSVPIDTELHLREDFQMMSKRSFYLILSLLLAMPILAARASAAQYQGGGGGQMGGGGRRGPMSPDDRLKQMTKDSDLTTDQQAKIKPILEDEQKKMMDLRNDTTSDRQTMRTKMMQIRKDSTDQIRGLLDDTQKAKFDKMEQEREQRMQNGRRGGGMGGPGGGGPGGPPENQ